MDQVGGVTEPSVQSRPVTVYAPVQASAGSLGAERRFRNTSSLIANLVVFLLVAASLSAAHGAARRHHASRPLNQDVQPTPEIDTRVAYEVAKATKILDDLTPDSLFASPFLVSAIYYHDNFLTSFPVDRNSADPERRIIGQISKVLSPEAKMHFVQLLDEVWARSQPVGPVVFTAPVIYSASSGGRRSHRYAIDLFAPEGASVYSVSRGMVILADGAWSLNDLFSTTSRKGGNAVIVFDPDQQRFYRYCHMSAVRVSAGNLVATGQIIGNVGHTGLNASQPGHGHHLHFEANEYVDRHVRAIDYQRLRKMLRQWRASPVAKGS
jgi:murein DD-endopeptidase MepM/ murein hydrolase activator NlpD